MIRLDHNILSDINGRGNGGNYRRNWCGFKWQGNSTKKRNSSPAQKFINARYGRLFRIWQKYPSSMTKKQQDSWKQYAREHPIKNKKGELKPTTDRNAFISYNMERLLRGLNITYDAPIKEMTPQPKPAGWILRTGVLEVRTQIVLPYEINMYGVAGLKLEQFKLKISPVAAARPTRIELHDNYTIWIYWYTWWFDGYDAELTYTQANENFRFENGELVRSFKITVHSH